MSELTFDQAKQAYLSYIKADYDRWYTGGTYTGSREVAKHMMESNQYSLDAPGARYQRVVHNTGSQRCSHSFIVREDYTTPKGLVLKKGDILKCASWKTPALNFVRGNVFQPGSWGSITWTGA